MAAALSAPLVVPPSILDTDLYKFTMQQAIMRKFPDVPATYRFTNRNHATTRFSRRCFERFRAAVARFSLLKLTQEEKAWLAETCPYLDAEYLDYLEKFRFVPEQVVMQFIHEPRPEDGPEEDYGQIEIEAVGPWVETILWEVPLMACLSETYFQTCDRDWGYEGLEDTAYTKGKTLLSAGCAFNEFGTRRRRDRRTHEAVVRELVKAQQDVELDGTEGKKGKLLGTSNVHFARLFGLNPVGTIAHEWFMGVAALTGYENANGRALDLWEEVYPAASPGVSLIALTDTFTTDAFFKDFAADAERAARWTGLRQDSGDPKLFAPRVKEFYESLGVDPREKLLVYSDALTVAKCLDLQKQCEELGLQKVSFGIGTHLTNDFRSISSGGKKKSKALNMVIKLREVGGQPCVKLSDDLSKTTGDKGTVKHVIETYHLGGKM